MKRALFTLIFLTLGAAHADVVKPPNTTEKAESKTHIEGSEIKYTVQDRGWFSHYDSSKGLFTGTKTFLLEYTLDPEWLKTNDSLVSDLKADTQKKCQELGEMEFSAVDHKALGNAAGNFTAIVTGLDLDPTRMVTACRVDLNFKSN